MCAMPAKERARRYRLAHPERVTKEARRPHRQHEKPHSNAYMRRYRKEHLENIRRIAREAACRYRLRDPAKRGYNAAKYVSKKIGRSFRISLKNWRKITSSKCFYCGCSNAGGVDRINCAKGYTHKNAVPCCITCNRMKWNIPLEIFLDHVKKIGENYGFNSRNR